MKYFALATILGSVLSMAQAATEKPPPALFVPGLVSTGFDDSHSSFSPDGKTLYFLRNTPDFMHWTIVVSRATTHGWSVPAIAPFSGRWSDADVFVTRDDKRLFFISTRPVNGQHRGDTDIWTMARTGTGWSEPRHVPELSSEGFEWFPTLTESGVVYFGSERQGGLGQSDIWRAHWLGDRFSTPENLGPIINSSDQEIEPFIAPDESWMIFAARGHNPGFGSYDIYITYNCLSGWTKPRQLGAGVNSPAWDFAPHVSPDGRRLYFTSNRASTLEAFDNMKTLQDLEYRLHSPQNGLRDIYHVNMEDLDIQRDCDTPAN